MQVKPRDPQEEIEAQQFFMRGTIDRIEESSAVVRLDNGEEIRWPREKMPDDAGEGTVCRLVLATSETDTEERARIARQLLNEIIGPRSEAT